MPRAFVRPASLAALLALLLATAGAFVPAAAPALPLPIALEPVIARAADQLDIETAARYVVDPGQHRVWVTVDVTAVNQKPVALGGGTVTRYFYNGVSLGIQPEAAHLHATQDGSAVPVKTAARTGYRLVTLSFRANIYYQQAARVRLTYDLPAGKPRSESDVRVGPAFATFVAWAFGDRGSVQVEVPADFRVDVSGDTMQRTLGADGYQAYAATTTTPAAWYATVDASDDAALTHDTLHLSDGQALIVQAWPEDDRWRTRVHNVLARGVPDLVTMIGLAWPVKGALTVSEVHTPLLEGYAGFYDPQTDRITVSEDLDDLTIVHEASHAWFNASLFGERWITEGLADEYASRVLATLGRPRQGPGVVKRSSPAAFALEHWPPPAPIRDPEHDAQEQYGYAAAWTAMRTIVGLVGEDAMRHVFAEAEARTTGYPGEGSPEQTRLPNDWRRFLDLTEQQAPSHAAGIEDAVKRWALEAADARLLGSRAAARAAYARLVADGGTWAPPDAVRSAMDAWNFGPATNDMNAATTVLEARDEVTSLATAQGLEPPAGVEARYQGASTGSDLARLGDQLRSSEEALHHLGAAADALAVPRDWVTDLGLDGRDPAASLDSARTAWAQGDLDAATAGADAAVAMLAAAPEAGRSRAVTVGGAVAVVVLVLLVLAIVLAVRRRRPRPVASPAVVPWPGPYATLPPDGPPSVPAPAPSPPDEGAP